MRKLLGKLLIVLCAVGLVTLLGCSAFQDVVTPAYIEPEAIEYTDEEPTSFMPFTTVWDALRIDCKLDFVHGTNQLNLARLAEDDMRLYNFLNDRGNFHLQNAREFQSNIFNPDGPIGLLLPTLLGGTLGATLLSKPADKKKIAELEKKVAKNGQ